MTRYCPNCGAPHAASTTTCTICGVGETATAPAALDSPSSGAPIAQDEHDLAEGPFSAARDVLAVQRPKLGPSRRAVTLAGCLLLLAVSLLCLGLFAILAEVAWTMPQPGSELGALMAILSMHVLHEQ